QQHPELAGRMHRWLSLSDYVLWRLTGAYATDYTIASRTLLLDQSRLDWSDRLLEMAGMPRQALPPVYPGGTLVGQVTAQAAAETGLPQGTPCALGGHDHLCGTLAAGVVQPGQVVDSSGTSQSLVMILKEFRTGPALAGQAYACYAYLVPGRYILKGGQKSAGGTIQWLARQLSGGAGEAALPYAELEAEAAAGVGKKAGPLWLPHFIGSGAPDDDRFSRAALVGAQIEHERGDVFRGMLEGIACFTRRSLEQMQAQAGQPLQQVVLLGGTTRFELLVQLKADVLGMPVLLPSIPEASACGAALLAGLGAGVFATPAEAVASLRYPCRTIQPDPARSAWYAELYARAYQPLYAALRDVNHALAHMDGER
ncbi:MAG: FGGY-family carbohydrate kinase, partial [Anaerolineaceae bacterium]|nr:FGGY-family carbohydrate kinase [Anaerolineaceae bacterium]